MKAVVSGARTGSVPGRPPRIEKPAGATVTSLVTQPARRGRCRGRPGATHRSVGRFARAPRWRPQRPTHSRSSPQLPFRWRPSLGVNVSGRRFLREVPVQRRRTYTRDCTSITHRAHPRTDRRAVRFRGRPWPGARGGCPPGDEAPAPDRPRGRGDRVLGPGPLRAPRGQRGTDGGIEERLQPGHDQDHRRAAHPEASEAAGHDPAVRVAAPRQGRDPHQRHRVPGHRRLRARAVDARCRGRDRRSPRTRSDGVEVDGQPDLRGDQDRVRGVQAP